MEPIGQVFQDLEHLSDLVLVSADGVEFHVHKVFLARSSPLFRDMLSSTSIFSCGDGQASGHTRLQLHVLIGCELEAFLECIYMPAGGSASITQNNVKMLTEASRKYQMPTLLAAIDEFCCQSVEVNSGNVVEWLLFAYEYGLQGLSRRCDRVMEKANLVQMIGHLTEEELGSLSKDVTIKILKRASKGEGCGFQVFLLLPVNSISGLLSLYTLLGKYRVARKEMPHFICRPLLKL